METKSTLNSFPQEPSRFERGQSPHPLSVVPDEAAEFAQLYAMYFKDVRRFLDHLNVPTISLDDLVQEAFLRAWAGRANYVPKASLKTWLFAIARNVVREWRRQRSVSALIEAEMATEDITGYAIADREQSQAVQNAVERLPPKQQQAIRLVYFSGLGLAQAAAEAGCDECVLRWRLADARAQLRHLMRGENAG